MARQNDIYESKPAPAGGSIADKIVAAVNSVAKSSGTAAKSTSSKTVTAKAAPPDTSIGAGRTRAQAIETRDATSDPTRYLGLAGKQAADSISGALANWKPLTPEPTGGGGLLHLASILDPVPLASGALHGLEDAGKFIGVGAEHLGSDLLHAIPHYAESIGELAPAIWDDLKHGRLGISAKTLGGGKSKTAQIVEDSFGASATNDLIHGRILDALKKFYAHPLYTGTEFAGDLGILGRAGGVVGRSGLVGDHAFNIADIARGDRTLLPELRGQAQRYSENPLVKYGITKQLEKHPDAYAQIRKLTGRSVERELNHRLDRHVAAETGAHDIQHQALAKAIRESMPKEDAGYLAQHMAMGTIGSAKKLLDNAEETRQVLQAAIARHEEVAAKVAAHEPLTAADHRYLLKPEEIKQNLKHQESLDRILGAPHVEGIGHEARAAADAYRTRQDALEEELHQLQLQEPEQTLRRTYLPMYQSRAGAFKVEGSGIPTDAAKAAIDARRERNAAFKEWQDAKHAYEVDIPKHEVEMQKQLRAAENSAHKARGNADQSLAAQRLARVREAIGAERPIRKAEGKIEVKRLEDAYKLKDAEFRASHKANLNKKYTGFVVPDQFADPIRAGVHRGQRLRPVTTQEMLDFAQREGIPRPSYVDLRSPQQRGNRLGIKRGVARGGGTKEYTGRNLPIGAYSEGFGALADSQLGTHARLGKAKLIDSTIHEFGIGKPGGMDFSRAEAEQIAPQYSQAHGVPVTPIARHMVGLTDEQHAAISQLQDTGKLDEAANTTSQYALQNRLDPPANAERPDDRWVLMPTTTLNRLEQHLGLRGAITAPFSGRQFASLGGHNPLGSTIRAFRNTTLPYSTKWITGNVAEHALVRGPLTYGNPITGHLRVRLYDGVVKTMEDLGLQHEADRFKALTLGGAHFGFQHRDNLAVISNRAAKEGVAAVGQALVHANERLAQVSFGANSKLEQYFQKAIVGQHMHDQLVSWAGGWAKALGAERQFYEQLARGYADPKLAEAAVKYMHDSAGQYNAMSPAARWFVTRVSPYAPWSFASLKFIYYTLPVKHSFTAGALSAVAAANHNAWVAQHEDAKGLAEKNSILGVPFSGLLTDIPTSDGGLVDIARYTPFGIAGDGPLDTATGLVFPEFQGALHAAFGQDPFGNNLKNADGSVVTDGEKILLAASSLLEGLAGPISQIHRVVAGQGGTLYNTTPLWDWNPKIKPGSQHTGTGIVGGLRRVFNPLQPTYLHNNAGGSAPPPTGPGQAPLEAPPAQAPGASSAGSAPGTQPLEKPPGSP